MSDLQALRLRPKADSEAVEELVRLAREGRVRVPTFQRPLRWAAKDVLELFDSVYRGLPIGSMLLWRHPARAERVRVGPLVVDAHETSDAMWVVDGQQRLTAMAASLGRPLPLPAVPSDPYVVYFDAEAGVFESGSSSGSVPDTWIPAPLLIDAAVLGEWTQRSKHAARASWARAAYDAGKRIREYRVPYYVVETDDEDVLRLIFLRVNKTGKALEWPEVHDALFGREGEPPTTVAAVAEALDDLSTGRLEDRQVLLCALAARGLDVTRPLDDHVRRDASSIRHAVRDALPPLRATLQFLRTDVGVPHVRLLPTPFVLEALSRFFALHPEPGFRTRTLLTRWAWRTFAGRLPADERTVRRRAVASVGPDEEESVQLLLRLCATSPSALVTAPPRVFDARVAATRVTALAMASLGPRDLTTGEAVDLPALLDARGSGAFVRVVPSAKCPEDLVKDPANRLFHPVAVPWRRLVELARSAPDGDAVLGSHGIGGDSAEALRRDDAASFLGARRASLARLQSELVRSRAAFDRGDLDRPTIDRLLATAATDV